MGTKVFFGNLPPGTTVDEVRAELKDVGDLLLGIEQVDEGDSDRLLFVADLDIDLTTARIMADRRKGRYFKGRRLNVYVPLMQG